MKRGRKGAEGSTAVFLAVAFGIAVFLVNRRAAAKTTIPGCSSNKRPNPGLPSFPKILKAHTWFAGEKNQISHHAQGVTNDGGNWYFSQTNRITKVPARESYFDLELPVRSEKLENLELGKIYNHLGDLDFFDEKLYVAVDPVPGYPGVIAVFDSLTLDYLEKHELSVDQITAPWVAIRKSDGVAFSSNFEADRLFAYELPSMSVREVELRCGDRPYRISRVQGGTFGPDGLLYLASDDDPGGIFAVNPDTGEVGSYLSIPRSFQKAGFRDEEIEGITYWDLGKYGQLHVSMLSAFHLPTEPDSLTLLGFSLRS